MIKLLIADDEGFVRSGLIKNIKWAELGVDSIEQADDGLNAFEKLLEFEPDIVLTDVRMPRMDGIELAAKIKEILPECKIIFMSAYSDKEYLKSAINLKALSYIEKPIDPQEISASILSAVALCKEDEKRKIAAIKSEKSLMESQQILHNNIAIELISSNFSKKYIQKWIDTSDILLPIDGKFTVIIMKLKLKVQVINPDGNTNKTDMLNMIKEKFSSIDVTCISGFKDKETIVNVIYKRQLGNYSLNISILEEACLDIFVIFKENYETFISIGNVVNNIFLLSDSLQAAVISSQELFFKGYGNLTLSKKYKNETFEFDEALINELGLYLENGEKEESLKLIRNLTKNIKPQMNTLVNYIKNVYFRLLLQLINSSAKRGINLYSNETESFYWEIISGYDTLEEIEEYLIKLINSFYKQVEERTACNRTVADIIKIINKSYGDSNLTIKSISEKLFLSHSYLCVIFKKETGKTINQYITEFRVDKAKELLKDKGIKLYDIATRVGYLDHNYFTKIFKKTTNTTPTEYKEKYVL